MIYPAGLSEVLIIWLAYYGPLVEIGLTLVKATNSSSPVPTALYNRNGRKSKNLPKYFLFFFFFGGGGEAMTPFRSYVPRALNDILEVSFKTFCLNLTKCSVRDHSSITSAKRWVGGVKNGNFCWFTVLFMLMQVGEWAWIIDEFR